jgi:TrmH family RNA methyltransferase
MRPKPRPFVVRPVPDLTPEFVRCLHHRRFRDDHGLFLAEGARFLTKAVDHGAAFAGLVICPFRLQGSLLRELVTRLERADVPLIKVSPSEYAALSPGTSSQGENAAAGQGVLLILRQSWGPLPPEPRPDDCWIGIESVRTTGNLGTLLRSGEAAGATGLIVFDRSEGGSESGVDPHDPAAVRATMGSLFAHRLVRTTHRAFRRSPGAKGLAVYGGTPDAARDYRGPDYRRPVLLMLGDERTGLSDGQRKTCNEFVRIPMAGAPDSLNLAMAGTLMLYEVHNQRHPFDGTRREPAGL